MLSGIIEPMTVSNIEQAKRCGACGIVKRYSEFSRDRSKRDGYMYRCKECDRQRNRKAYARKVGPVRVPITSCSIDGCTEPHVARGYCARHYAAWNRGTLNKPKKNPSGRTRTESVECLECGTTFERFKLSAKRASLARQLCGQCRSQPKLKPEPFSTQKRCEHCGCTYEAANVAQRFCTPLCRKQRERENSHRPGKKCRGCGADMSSIKYKHYCRACKPESYDRTRKYNCRCVDCGDEFWGLGRSFARCEECQDRRDIEAVSRQREERRRSGRDYRARARAAGVHYEPVNVRSVFERDEWTCGICGGAIDSALKYPNPLSASLDHIVPISLGGPHTYDNVQAAHWKCNVNKGNSEPVI